MCVCVYECDKGTSSVTTTRLDSLTEFTHSSHFVTGAAAAVDPVSLTDEEAAAVRLELEQRLEEVMASAGDNAAATDAWLRFDAATRGHSQELCEQLRLILEASLASKLAGDYRTWLSLLSVKYRFY